MNSQRLAKFFVKTALLVFWGCCVMKVAHNAADAAHYQSAGTKRGYQVQLRLSSGFANQLLHRQDKRTEPVRESLLGARIEGTQTTRANTSLKFIPNASHAEVRIITSGETSSYTHAYRNGIIVQNQGHYRFQVYKDVMFDRFQLITKLPRIQVQPQQANLRVQSPASQVPIFGPIVDHTALHIANKQIPKAEIVAAQRLTKRLTEEVNRTIDSQLAGANRVMATQIGRIANSLSNKGARLETISTTKEIKLRAYYPCVNCSIEPGEIIGDVPWPVKMQLQNRLAVSIHQSFVNEIFGVQRLAGQKISDQKFDDLVRYATDQLLAGNLQEAIQPDPDLFKESKIDQANLIMDQQKPIWLQFDEGKMRLNLRAEFETESGIRTKPHDISIQFAPQISKNQVLLRHETITVLPVGQPMTDPAAETIARVIQQTFQKRARDIKLKNHRPLPLKDKSLWLDLRHLLLQDGWLMLYFSLSQS